MTKKILPFAPPSLGQEEIDAVVNVMRKKWLTMGEKTIELENKLKDYTGAKHIIVVNSCTAALHLSLIANDITEGEVITSPLTFAATANTIIHAGAKPIFVDIDKETLNMDPNKIEEKITDKTKAIIAVHYAGQPCNMDKINEIAKKHNLIVIEDAAHAIGAEYNKEKIGKNGIVCFSFYATKNMTTGEGGAIAVEDEKLAKKLRSLRLHGIDKDAWKRYSTEGSWFYEIKHAGWKYNLTDLQAVIGIEQLKKLDGFTKRKQEIANEYNTKLNKEFFILPNSCEGHACHLYPIQLKLNKLKINRAEFIEEMLKHGIQTSVHFIPLHLHPLYKEMGYEKGMFPNAEQVYEAMVSLPIYPTMTDKNIQDVIEAANLIGGNKS
ncbi:UDP-4-amino-4,6-dideoxy-N-acetyl-beta-L-altrosamine transaminase [archaeon]|nr:UDP-4-amino-4,6-dideoxy-N-acetyl-beta-L-altrosamine transaminase [archaeon]